jgi:ribosome biogenesis GTPase
VAGAETAEQVLAANVDKAFLVMGLDGNFNIRRIERFLTTAWDSGAAPVVILNKADLQEDPDSFVSEVEAVAMGVPVLLVSALEGRGMETIREHARRGETIALFGSSGVGKSTIINRLLGEERLATREVSEMGARGRHTTTHRELIPLPDGGVLIDTPGLREVQLWADSDSLDRSFEDIAALAPNCRFRDCSHVNEPGCAVLAAVADGQLDEARYKSFLKQRRELAFLEIRQDQRARRRAEKEWGKKISLYLKDLKKRKPNR